MVKTKSEKDISWKNGLYHAVNADAVRIVNDSILHELDSEGALPDDPYVTLVKIYNEQTRRLNMFPVELNSTFERLGIPKNEALVRSILGQLEQGSQNSTAILDNALKEMPELPTSQKENFINAVRPSIDAIRENQNLLLAQQKIALDDDLLSEKAQARATILSSLGADFVSIGDVLGSSEQSRARAFFKQGSEDIRKDPAVTSQLHHLLGGGQHLSLSPNQESVKSITPEKIISAVIPKSAALQRIYDTVTSTLSTVANTIAGWFTKAGKATSSFFSRFLPESKRKGEYETFLDDKQIKQGEGYSRFNPDRLAKYNDLYRLIKTAEIQNTPLEKSYLLNELKTDKEVQTYLEFASNMSEAEVARFDHFPLKEKLSTYSDDSNSTTLGTYDPKQVQMTLIVSKIKELQNRFLDESQRVNPNAARMNAITQELAGALDDLRLTNTDKHQIREAYLYPGADNIMKTYFQQSVKPVLEKLIDNEHVKKSDKDGIRGIYSKIANNVMLDRVDITNLREIIASPYVTESEQQFLNATLDGISGLRKSVETNPAYKLPKDKKIEQAKTPNEIEIDNIQKYLEKSTLVVNEINNNLEAQLKEMRTLQTYTTPHTDLNELCAKKIKYLSEIKAAVGTIKTEIEDKKAAKIVQQTLNNPENVTPASNFSENPLRSLFKLIPINLAKNTTEVEQSLFAQMVARVDSERVVNAKKDYETALHQHEMPELLPFLSDPFEYGNFIQNQEALVEQMLSNILSEPKIREMLKQSRDLSAIVVQNLIKIVTQEVVGKIPVLGGALSHALGSVLAKKEVKDLITTLIGAGTTTMQQGITNKLTESLDTLGAAALKTAKSYVCRQIGIELRSEMEANALKFIDPNSKIPFSEVEAIHDAFSVFYLQYRAIKEQNKGNERFDKNECVKFLFKSVDIHDTKTQNNILKIFEKYDQQLYLEKHLENGVKNDIDSQLYFLLNNLDLADPANHGVVRMALFNQLLLIKSEASQYGLSTTDKRSVEELSQQVAAKIESIRSPNLKSKSEKAYVLNYLEKSKGLLSAMKKPDVEGESANFSALAEFKQAQKLIAQLQSLKNSIPRLDPETKVEFEEQMHKLNDLLEVIKADPELANESKMIEQHLRDYYDLSLENNISVTFLLPKTTSEEPEEVEVFIDAVEEMDDEFVDAVETMDEESSDEVVEEQNEGTHEYKDKFKKITSPAMQPQTSNDEDPHQEDKTEPH